MCSRQEALILPMALPCLDLDQPKIELFLLERALQLGDVIKLCTVETMESSSCTPPNTLRVSINDNAFFVDKRTLSENCEYFRALFQSGMKECRQEEIQLHSVGTQGFLVLLQVLAGERPMLNSDQIVEAIECAAFLQVPALTKHLINIINSENCLLMYHTAATYGVLELSRRAALFIRDMYPDLREDVHTLPNKLVEYIESLLPSSYMAVCSHSPSTELLEDVQRTVCYLDEEHRGWRVLTHLPGSTSTTMAGVAVLDNKLYIIGGVHDWTAMSGHYGNSKGSLLTAVVRGDSVFTLSRHVTREYTVDDHRWRVKREMEGFGRIGSIYTFLMRLPKATTSLMGNCRDVTQGQNLRDLKLCPKLSPQCSHKL
ncbi:hypothetical protein Q5P01_006086 [Channa striata]|uniref:BTB domain-containing protein n=1 Tax=Channa striata TaxID=64152 RepID=A0AA88NAF0_CHASR|nr:hypothetical protein Q5P01_006086 [Channa striata]